MRGGPEAQEQELQGKQAAAGPPPRGVAVSRSEAREGTWGVLEWGDFIWAPSRQEEQQPACSRRGLGWKAGDAEGEGQLLEKGPPPQHGGREGGAQGLGGRRLQGTGEQRPQEGGRTHRGSRN